ncbi:MAG TPA: hypothetical protein VHA56_09235 [Mucilaginibacter sp.]|nr:hypothetical protein [Mucilaginibacter sp.]
MTLKMPKGAEKIDASRVGDLKVRKLDKKKADFFRDHIYLKDDLLNYYTYRTDIPLLRKGLENRQRQMVSLLRQNPSFTVTGSDIVTYNNIKYLIIKYQEDNQWYIWYSSDYNKEGSFINGFIQYSKGDDLKAKQYLEDMLSTTKFNNQ